jgi:hypothetical protein
MFQAIGGGFYWWRFRYWWRFPLTLPCVPPSFELFALPGLWSLPRVSFSLPFLGCFFFFLIKGWQGFIIYKCARNNVSNLSSTILFMWSVSRRRRRRLETDYMTFCVCVYVCVFWLVGETAQVDESVVQ